MTVSHLLKTVAISALIAETVIILLASESVTLLSDVSRIPFRVASATSVVKLARRHKGQPIFTE
jgi:hypothetical protein